MTIKNLTLSILSLLFAMTACKEDDDLDITTLPIRDEGEVYDENIEEIEDYLKSHSFNYEEFNFNNLNSIENDTFNLQIFPITDEDPDDKIALYDMMGGEPGTLMDALKFKIVTQNGIDYKLYFLKIREGEGESIHRLDRAVLNYKGFLTDGTLFDSAITPTTFYLTTIGSIGGVVKGFREGLIEFKTSEGVTTAPDGVDTFKNHGIGAIFIPSGLAYFNGSVSSIEPYNPIIFTINLIGRLDTDYDNDAVPSHLEDHDGDGDGFNDNKDGDDFPDFLDNDDDGDGVLTINEDLEDTDPNVDSDGDGDPNNDKNGDGNPANDDTNNDGTPNYLDANFTESN